nr:ribosome silencing factor [Azospirillum halopraeferens]
MNTHLHTVTAPVPPAPVPQELKALIEKSLDDDQADHIVVIDLAGKTSIADYMIVASGRNARHIAAMADRLREKVRDIGIRHVEIEGMPQCDWVLIDAGDVIVHLFRPEVRSFYNIEKMWGLEAPAVEPQRLWA